MCSCGGPNLFGKTSAMTEPAVPPAGRVAGPVLVVGAGLIGTSIGMRLRELGVPVWLDDSDSRAVDVAVLRGAGERSGSGQGDPALVVVAIPPGSVAAVASDMLARYPEAVVCDVASTKSGIVAGVAECAGPAAARFVGTHPMAGREVSGPNGARSDLFEHRRWVITPTAANSESAIAAAVALAEACDAVVVRLEPEVHDRAAALASHLPQIVASALAAQLEEAPAEDVVVSGQGLRDMVRIADSDPVLWADILDSNRSQVAPVLNRLIDDLGSVAGALVGSSQSDADVVKRLLERGSAGRARLPDKHGGAAPKYGSVTVVVSDRPGELGRLFAAAGRAQVNLEDVRIEHSVGRLKAFIELSLLPERVDALRGALVDEGWEILG